MKPSLVFYNDGSYTGIHHGDVQVGNKVDAYNSYMDKLMRPDLCLFVWDVRPPYYGGWQNKHNKMYSKLLTDMTGNIFPNKAP